MKNELSRSVFRLVMLVVLVVYVIVFVDSTVLAQQAADDNIVWGTFFDWLLNIVWGT